MASNSPKSHSFICYLDLKIGHFRPFPYSNCVAFWGCPIDRKGATGNSMLKVVIGKCFWMILDGWQKACPLHRDNWPSPRDTAESVSHGSWPWGCTVWCSLVHRGKKVVRTKKGCQGWGKPGMPDREHRGLAFILG